VNVIKPGGLDVSNATREEQLVLTFTYRKEINRKTGNEKLLSDERGMSLDTMIFVERLWRVWSEFGGSGEKEFIVDSGGRGI
jgi:hypothetical protein